LWSFAWPLLCSLRRQGFGPAGGSGRRALIKYQTCHARYGCGAERNSGEGRARVPDIPAVHHPHLDRPRLYDQRRHLREPKDRAGFAKLRIERGARERRQRFGASRRRPATISRPHVRTPMGRGYRMSRSILRTRLIFWSRQKARWVVPSLRPPKDGISDPVRSF
jgi:hypothetical protein